MLMLALDGGRTLRAQDLRITEVTVDPQGRVVFGYPAKSNSYYILYRGELTNISTPADIVLGELSHTEAGTLTSDNLSQSLQFFRIREVPVSRPIDSDGDGIDDVYELRHRAFLNPLERGDADLDMDSNGRTAFEEYRAQRPHFIGSLDGRLAFGALITADGELWAWGDSSGDGTQTRKTSAIRIGKEKDWASLSQSPEHTLAVKKDGTLWAWGRNREGQLGIVGVTESRSPQQVGTGNDWAAVSAGGTHSMAIKRDGTLWGWGANDLFQTGVETHGKIAIPTQIGTAKDWAAVRAGGGHSIAMKRNGRLVAFPRELSMFPPAHGTPGELGGTKTWSRISAGYYISAMIASDGTLWSSEVVFDPFRSEYQGAPLQVGNGTDWWKVATINDGTSPLSGALALKEDGSLWHFWAGGSAPRRVGGDSDWTHVEATGPRIVGAKKDGTAYVIAGTYAGVTTDMINSPTDSPIRIGIDYGWGRVGGSLAYRKDGTAWDVTGARPFQIGSDTDWKSIIKNWNNFGWGLKSDGTLWRWDSLKLEADGAYHIQGLKRASKSSWRTTPSPRGIKEGGTLWEHMRVKVEQSLVEEREQIDSFCQVDSVTGKTMCLGYTPLQMVREYFQRVKAGDDLVQVQNPDGSFSYVQTYITNYYCCTFTNDVFTIVTNASAVYDAVGNEIKPADVSTNFNASGCVRRDNVDGDAANWHVTGWKSIWEYSAIGDGGDLWFWWDYPTYRMNPLRVNIPGGTRQVLGVNWGNGFALSESGEIWGWGWDVVSQVVTNVYKVPSDSDWDKISSVGLKKNGELWEALNPSEPNVVIHRIGVDDDWNAISGSLALKRNGLLFEAKALGTFGTPNNLDPITIFPAPEALNVGRLVGLALAVDANRDGFISFKNEDRSWQNQPFQFWVNNDRDRLVETDAFPFDYDEEDDAPASIWNPLVDSADAEISIARDLEDFFRLHLAMDPELVDQAGQVRITMGASDERPIRLRIFPAVDGGLGYLQDTAAATAQIQIPFKTALGLISEKEQLILRDGDLEKLRSSALYFLVEGVEKGTGKLRLEIEVGGDVLQSDELWINVEDIKSKYELWTVGSNGQGTEAAVPATIPSLLSGFTVEPLESEKDYVLLVHGWNMTESEKIFYAETTYKRLWHQGFKGRFGAFTWPTLVEEDFGKTYNPSEFSAWRSGEGLLNTIYRINNRGHAGRIRLLAHSQGNVVAAEALRSANRMHVVHTYVATQAAIPAEVYDALSPNLVVDWSTPNYLGEYWMSGSRSYCDPDYMAGSASVFVNFFNKMDYALDKWRLKQVLDKPSLLTHQIIDGDLWRIAFPGKRLIMPEDRFEIFAMIIQGRTLALGAQDNVGGVFAGNQVDLSVAPYGFGDHPRFHGGQFRASAARHHEYWRTFMDKAELRAAPLQR